MIDYRRLTAHSLDYNTQLAFKNIQAHRQPMLRCIQPMTPADSASPIVTLASEDTRPLAARMKQAKIDIAIYPHASAFPPRSITIRPISRSFSKPPPEGLRSTLTPV